LSVDNYFTRQNIPEDKSELHTRRREHLKSLLILEMFGRRSHRVAEACCTTGRTFQETLLPFHRVIKLQTPKHSFTCRRKGEYKVLRRRLIGGLAARLRIREMHTKIWSGNVKGRELSGDLFSHDWTTITALIKAVRPSVQTSFSNTSLES
jgi:hypothetical protein